MRFPYLVLSGCLLLVGTSVASDEPSTDVDSQTLKQGQVGVDGPALLEFFRKRTPSTDHRTRIPALIGKLNSNQFAVRQEASRKLEEYGALALPFLRAAGKGKSLEVNRRVESCVEAIERNLVAGLSGAAARMLRKHRPSGASPVLLDYLPYAEDRAIEEEILATLLVLGPAGDKVDSSLLAALTDPVAVKRAAAALVVLRSADREQRAAGRKLLADRDHLVRLRAAQALLLDRDREAVPMLVALLEAPGSIALQAEEILVRIAGSRAPAVALRPGDEAERRKCRDAWNGWWREHGAKTELPRMDDFRCQLGYTLVVEYAMGNGTDRLVELGPDGRQRWRIENLQYPVDAAVIADNRVLIVEHNAKRVCERDFKGTIVWEKEVSGGRGPFAAQRLANGHTFIVSHHQLLEVDAEGKEVWSRAAEGFQYLGASKMRDGQVVYLTSDGDCVRLDAGGKVARTFASGHATHWISGIDVLPGGNILVPQHGLNKVVEFDADGKAVWEAKVPLPKSATRLPNGRTLVTSFENRNVVELDRAGKVLWEYKEGMHPYRARRR